jgi:hypothetical protein
MIAPCFYAKEEARYMYSGFKYESIPLKDIALDDRNPRIVTQAKLSSQDERLAYLFEYEDLERFIKKISSEGKNVALSGLMSSRQDPATRSLKVIRV